MVFSLPQITIRFDLGAYLTFHLPLQIGIGITSYLNTAKYEVGEDALLLSARSGARASMPGMMDTVLNLGMNDEIVEGFARQTGNKWAAWDSYRRFIQMYGDVVMDLKPENKDDIDPFEAIIEEVKEKRGIHLDTDLTVDDLRDLTVQYRTLIKKQTGKDFPTDPHEQLWGAILAVFNSWMNKRAISYRKLYNIPESWGTAVNVQAMVFGNMGQNSATGVAFTRDPATGEDLFTGEYLINAQGEDVVAGIRTPQQITLTGSKRWAERAGIAEEERKSKYPSLEKAMPGLYGELDKIQQQLEDHYKDMQDLEFTIQEGKLWLLQTRNGKRTGQAMVQIAIDMVDQGVIDESGLLGTWEFKTYEVNGISDMILYSGDFIVLNEDDLPGDREGKVRAYGPGYDRTGTFMLSVQNDSMTVFLEDDVNEYACYVEVDQLILDYIEDGNQYSTTWVKVP